MERLVARGVDEEQLRPFLPFFSFLSLHLNGGPNSGRRVYPVYLGPGFDPSSGSRPVRLTLVLGPGVEGTPTSSGGDPLSRGLSLGSPLPPSLPD